MRPVRHGTEAHRLVRAARSRRRRARVTRRELAILAAEGAPGADGVRVDVLERHQRIPGAPVVDRGAAVAVDRHLNLGAVGAQAGAHADGVVVDQVDDLEERHLQIVRPRPGHDGQVDRAGHEGLQRAEVRGVAHRRRVAVEVRPHVHRVGGREGLRSVGRRLVRATALAGGVGDREERAALVVRALTERGAVRAVIVPVHVEVGIEPALGVPLGRNGESAAGDGGHGVRADSGGAAVDVEAGAGQPGSGVRLTEGVGHRELAVAVLVDVERLAQRSVVAVTRDAVRTGDERLRHARRYVQVGQEVEALLASEDLVGAGGEAEMQFRRAGRGALQGIAGPEREARTGLQRRQASEGDRRTLRDRGGRHSREGDAVDVRIGRLQDERRAGQRHAVVPDSDCNQSGLPGVREGIVVAVDVLVDRLQDGEFRERELLTDDRALEGDQVVRDAVEIVVL